MSLLTELNPAVSVRIGSYDLLVLSAGRTEDGLEVSAQASNGTVAWADHLYIDKSSSRDSASPAIAAAIKKPSSEVDSKLLQLLPLVEVGLRATANVEAWPEPVPFSNHVPPPFPTQCLPSWLRLMVVATSEALQVPGDLPGMLTFPLLGAALAKKFTVKVRDGYFVPLNCYAMVGLESGERKSPAYRAMLDPFVGFERALIARVKLARAAEQEGGKKDDSPLPQLFADDITTEQVPVLLEQNGERAAIFSDEGDSLDIMAGKYSKGVPNFGVYLKAWDGGTYKVNRGMRPSIYLEHPLLSIGICLQPSVLRGLTETPAFRGRGLLGRFWYSLPRSFMGSRKTIGTPIPDEVKEEYRRRMELLLSIALPDRPSPLTLTHQAHTLFVAFEAELEPQLAPDGALRPIADWVAKLGGGVARLAGQLHMAGDESDIDTIMAETMRNAILIGRYLLAHALATFGTMSESPNTRDAQAIIAWIAKTGRATFSRRDICQGLRARFEHPDMALPALTTLIEHSWIREIQRDNGKRNGRPPSPTYEANPWIASQNPQNTQNPPSPEETSTRDGYSKPTQNMPEEPDWIHETPLDDEYVSDEGEI